MPKYTFKEFQAAYPGDAACLARIMIERHGGTLFCPRLRCESRFHAMTKKRLRARTFTCRQSIFGSMSRSFPTGATCATRTLLCSTTFWFRFRGRAYKTREILFVLRIFIRNGSLRRSDLSDGRTRRGARPSRIICSSRNLRISCNLGSFITRSQIYADGITHVIPLKPETYLRSVIVLGLMRRCLAPGCILEFPSLWKLAVVDYQKHYIVAGIHKHCSGSRARDEMRPDGAANKHGTACLKIPSGYGHQ